MMSVLEAANKVPPSVPRAPELMRDRHGNIVGGRDPSLDFRGGLPFHRSDPPAVLGGAADADLEFNGDPFRYGLRVPCLVLSPYAKAGHSSHQLNSHVSLVRFC